MAYVLSKNYSMIVNFSNLLSDGRILSILTLASRFIGNV